MTLENFLKAQDGFFKTCKVSLSFLKDIRTFKI